MRTATVSTDPRARRSREQIFAALHRAGRDGNLTTLSALSGASGVTRATIYNHFETLEEAAWFALRESFEHLMRVDSTERRLGESPDVVGVESLRRVITLLRHEQALARVADTYRGTSVLPGLAGILLETVTDFRADFAPTARNEHEAEDIYVAGGLYAVMSTGAWGRNDAGEVATVAYSLLPEWMRRPGPQELR